MHSARRRIPSLLSSLSELQQTSTTTSAQQFCVVQCASTSPSLYTSCLPQPQPHSLQGTLPGHRSISTSTASQAQLGSAVSLVLDSLGARLWEGGHTLTGLPWWASIPATTLAVRGLLLPLSIKAKAASVNVVLLNSAFSQARLLAQSVSPADAKALGTLSLVRAIYRQLRARHPAPGFKWYLANMSMQAASFALLTSSLNRMCETVWPGMNTEGLLYATDLTSPPVFMETWSTPYGTAGALLPLGLVLLYTRALSSSLAVRGAPGVHTALQLMLIPVYCVTLIQPHGTLLFWTSTAVVHLGLQASSLGRPSVLLPQPSTSSTSPQQTSSSRAEGESKADQQAAETSNTDLEKQQPQQTTSHQDPLEALSTPITEDRELLRQLGSYFEGVGRSEAAAVCLKLVAQAGDRKQEGVQ